MTALFQASLYAVPLILATLLIRSLAANRLPKVTLLVLWAVVLCKLCIPITLSSPWSIYALAGQWAPKAPIQAVGIPTTSAGPQAASPQTENLPQAMAENTVYPAVVEEAIQPAIVEGEAPVPTTPANIFSLEQALALIWALGAIGGGTFFISTHMRCRRTYGAALPVEEAYVQQWLQSHPLGRRVCIRQSDQISAPLTYGVLRPIILLPKTTNWQDTPQLAYILTHEWTHIQHFDVLWKWVLAAAVCFHWFNPLVWAMFVLANRDIEMCCDEAVVRSLGDTVKKAYALALIGLEERRRWVAPLCSNFSKHAIEERIISIMKYQKTSLLAVALSVVLVTGTTSALAFSAAPAPSSAPKAQTENTRNVTSIGGGEAYKVPMVTTVAPASQLEAGMIAGIREKDFTPYEPFGISYDKASDRLYYQGKLVRCFDDQYVLEGNIIGYSHYTPSGTVDVHTQRDFSKPIRFADGSFDPSGILLGVQPYSQAEFDARRLDDQQSTTNRPIAYASDGYVQSPDELAAQYSIYVPFGISYDKASDRLYYQGKLIYRLLDVMSTNGEDFSSGKFQGSMRTVGNGEGEISVEVIRDYSVLDAQGFGTIIGVKVAENLQWWSVADYTDWLGQEERRLQDIIGTQAWTSQRGFFIWTQARVDEAMGLYGEVLESIKRGQKVSKESDILMDAGLGWETPEIWGQPGAMIESLVGGSPTLIQSLPNGGPPISQEAVSAPAVEQVVLSPGTK